MVTVNGKLIYHTPCPAVVLGQQSTLTPAHGISRVSKMTKQNTQSIIVSGLNRAQEVCTKTTVRCLGTPLEQL